MSPPRSLLRSLWAWFVATSPWSELFSSQTRNDSVICIVHRETAQVVREYQCRTDGEAVSLEHELRDDLERLSDREFEDALDL